MAPTPSKKPGDSAKPLDFEKAMEQIEEIIARIESGEIGIEQSLAEYERGASLLKQCREIVQRAEQRVQELNAQMQIDEPSPSRGTTDAKEQGRSGKPGGPSADEGDEESPF